MVCPRTVPLSSTNSTVEPDATKGCSNTANVTDAPLLALLVLLAKVRVVADSVVVVLIGL